MKKGLLILGLVAGVGASAQSLTVDDTLSTGDTRAYYPLDSNAVNLASVTGTGCDWDYSDIAGYNGIASNNNNIVDASSTAWAGDYPTTSYSEAFENGVQTFFSNVGTEVIVDGFVYNDGFGEFVVTYDTDPLIAMQFPMSVGTTYTDPIDGTASIPTIGDIDIAGDADVTLDGAGTLTIGTNAYTNCVRVHTIEVSEGTFFGQTVEITRESYVYYDLDDANPMPIFRHDNVVADLDAGGVYGFSAVYSKDQVTNFVGMDKNESADFSVYPNPASDVINITLSEDAKSITVIDAAGKTVMTEVNPQTNGQYDVSSFEPGIYVVRIESESGIRTKKITIK